MEELSARIQAAEAFARDPRLVWEWYAWRRTLVAGCVPNAAHRAMAEWALRRDRVTIVTQNVDGLHARAAREVAGGQRDADAASVEVHGSLLRDRCSGCDARTAPVAVDATSVATLPRCTVCGSLLRPDVVWFGEMLDESVLAAADGAAATADVCLVVGTSALVHPRPPCRCAGTPRHGRIEAESRRTPLSEGRGRTRAGAGSGGGAAPAD